MDTVASGTLSQPAAPAQTSPGELQGEAGHGWPQSSLDLQLYFLWDHLLLLSPQKKGIGQILTFPPLPHLSEPPFRKFQELWLTLQGLEFSEDPSFLSLCIFTDRTHA